MKVTLFMATSVNGMIADKNGNEDFLSHTHWKTLVELANNAGNFIIGRKTYEVVKNWDEEYGFHELAHLERIIVSQTELVDADQGYTIASSPENALKKLHEKGHENALVLGGAHINSAFASANILDEVILNIEPALVGEGIPLLNPADFMLRLEFIESKNLNEGIVQLRYKVLK